MRKDHFQAATSFSWGLKLSQISLETDAWSPQHIMGPPPYCPFDSSWIALDCWRFWKLNWRHVLSFVVTNPRVSLVLMIKSQSNCKKTCGVYQHFFLAKDIRTIQQQGAFWDELCSKIVQWSSSVRPATHPSIHRCKLVASCELFNICYTMYTRNSSVYCRSKIYDLLELPNIMISQHQLSKIEVP